MPVHLITSTYTDISLVIGVSLSEPHTSHVNTAFSVLLGRAPNLAILLGPRVCIMYYILWYVCLTESQYNLLFLYYVQFMQGTWQKWLLCCHECRVCRLRNWKQWHTKSQTSGQIYCIVLPKRETYYSSKVGGVRVPYALVDISMSAGDGRHD